MQVVSLKGGASALKYGLPGGFFGFGVVFAIIVPFVAKQPGVGLVLTVLLLPVSVGALFYFIFRKLDLADEVQDAGDALVVRKSGDETRIPLANIASAELVEPNSAGMPQYVILTLRTPCRFGGKITYIPIDEDRATLRLHAVSHSVTQGLIARIQQTHSG